MDNHQVFITTVKKIIDNDGRYKSEAYKFIGEAVTYTAKKMKRSQNSMNNRHVSCVELLYGVSEYARMAFGPMAADVFIMWGLGANQDIGNVVFNMINENLLKASDNDSIEQFSAGPDFNELFRKPFEPKWNRVTVLPVD